MPMPPRKRKKKSSKTPAYLKSKRQLDSDGYDTIAIFAGALTTTLVLLLVLSHFISQARQAKAIEEASVGEKSKLVAELEAEKFDELVQQANAEQLAQILNNLNSETPGLTDDEQFDLNCRVLDVTNAMLTRSLNSQQRTKAVYNKIVALLKNVRLFHFSRLNRQDFSQLLREFADQEKVSPEGAIARIASLAILEVDAYAQARSGEKIPDVNRIAGHIVSVLNRFPDDQQAADQIKRVVSYYLSDVDKEVGVKLISAINMQKDRVRTPEGLVAINEISDLVAITDVRLDELFAERVVSGKQGHEKLTGACVELLKNRGSGRSVITRVDEVGAWLEQVEARESSLVIYEQMLSSAPRFNDEQVELYATKVAKSGLKRLSLLNEKLEITGIQFNGEPLSDSQFEGKSLLVCYWNNDPEEIGWLTELHNATVNWNPQLIQVLAVCTNDVPGAIADVEQKLGRFHLVVRDPVTGKLPLLEQCPAEDTRRAMLVGADGKVMSTRLGTENLQTEVELKVPGL